MSDLTIVTEQGSETIKLSPIESMELSHKLDLLGIGASVKA